MLNIKTKIAAASATAIILSSIMSSGAFAANDILISGNGAGSTNDADIIKVSKSKLRQKNTTVVRTHVVKVQNTGGNKANNNTGGSQSVITGNNVATTTVTVNGGTNTNSGENCCCDGQTTENSVEISGNGARSDNDALIVDVCKHKVSQKNTTIVGTSVTVVQDTGGNKTNNNTGGTNGIDTGNNTSTTTVSVGGSSNTN